MWTQSSVDIAMNLWSSSIIRLIRDSNLIGRRLRILTERLPRNAIKLLQSLGSSSTIRSKTDNLYLIPADSLLKIIWPISAIKFISDRTLFKKTCLTINQTLEIIEKRNLKINKTSCSRIWDRNLWRMSKPISMKIVLNGWEVFDRNRTNYSIPEIPLWFKILNKHH